MQKKKKVLFYLIDSNAEEEEAGEEVDLSFLDETLEEANAECTKRQKEACPYRSMDHITPTSNIVERLFSRCGITMKPHRRLMDPSTLEMLIMLRFNKDLWDSRNLDEVMKRMERELAAAPTAAPATATAATRPVAPATLAIDIEDA
jgi:hypothetical protein